MTVSLPSFNTMALYSGDGSNKQFDVPFPYLKTDHVYVDVAGDIQAFSFVNDSRIQLVDAPAAGIQNVRVYRNTPRDAMLHTIQQGTINPPDINQNDVQLLYILQELLDAEAFSAAFSIRLPYLLSEISATAASAAGKYVAIGTDGQPALVSGLPVASLPVSSVVTASIAAAKAAAVLLALGSTVLATNYSTDGDQGGGFFQTVASGTPDNGTIFATTNPNIFLKRIFQGRVQGAYYGLTANQSDRANNAARLNAALALAATLKVPYEHIKGQVTPCEGQITAASGMVIDWNGGGCDWSQSTTACANNANFYSAGSFTALPALNANVALNATSLVFVTGPSLSRDDVVFAYSTDATQVFNTTVSKTYLKGEAMEITSVNGSTVYLKDPTDDSYDKTKTALGRLNENNLVMSDMVAIGDAIGTVNTVYLGHLGRKSHIQNITVDGPSSTQVVIFDRCANVNAYNINATKREAPGGTSDKYAIQFSNCHNVHVWGGRASSIWHAWSVGGDNSAYNIVNRYVVAHGMYLTHDADSDFKVHTADIHGNSKYCGFDGCPHIDAVGMGGDQCFVVGKTTVYGGSALGLSGTAIFLTEHKSFNHYVAPEVTVYASGFSANSYGLVFDNNTANGGGRADNIGGTMRFYAKCYYNCTGGGATTQYLVSFNMGACTASDAGLDMSQAQFIFKGNDGTLGGGMFIIGTAGHPLAYVALPKKRSTYYSDVRRTKYLDGKNTVADCSGLGTVANHNILDNGNGFVDFDGAVGMGGAAAFIKQATDTAGYSFSALGIKAVGYTGKAVDIDCTGAVANIGHAIASSLGISVKNFDTFYYTPGVNDGTITSTGVTTFKTATFA